MQGRQAEDWLGKESPELIFQFDGPNVTLKMVVILIHQHRPHKDTQLNPTTIKAQTTLLGGISFFFRHY